jgi:hypothetical protein
MRHFIGRCDMAIMDRHAPGADIKGGLGFAAASREVRINRLKQIAARTSARRRIEARHIDAARRSRPSRRPCC